MLLVLIVWMMRRILFGDFYGQGWVRVGLESLVISLTQLGTTTAANAPSSNSSNSAW